MNNFWDKLARPFFVLAPLEGVTDAAFRRVIAEYSKYGGKVPFDESGKLVPHLRVSGGPHVMYTEFTSADGLVMAGKEGRDSLMSKLDYSEIERPIVAQLFSAVPERMEEAARIVAGLGFDGIDINMGCPDRKVEKQGCGAAMMRDHKKAREIIMAAHIGAPSLPVSVKTRIGYNEDELNTWLTALLEESVAAVAIHARTRKEMSKVPAHWDAIARAVSIRDSCQSGGSAKTLIIGNGDVRDLRDAREKARKYGCDGVMLGRAIYGNPLLFSADWLRESSYGPRERIEILGRHLELFRELMEGGTSYAVMKKHFKSYISGMVGAKELRAKLMRTDTAYEALRVLSTAHL